MTSSTCIFIVKLLTAEIHIASLFLCLGDRFDVTVERSSPAVGSVEVGWTIEGVNHHLPQLNFQDTNGTLLFVEVGCYSWVLMFVQVFCK